jgi:hypothetical protein
MTSNPFGARVRSRSDAMRRSTHAGSSGSAACVSVGPTGPVYHSILSAAWSRVKGTVAAVVSAVPIIGGVASNIIDSIHTGDEHQDPTTGIWVNNSTGAPTVGVPSSALYAQIAQTNAFNAAEVARVRQQAADLAAKAGIAAGAAIGPAGNIYQQMIAGAGPLGVLLAVVAVGGLIFLVMRRKS